MERLKEEAQATCGKKLSTKSGRLRWSESNMENLEKEIGLSFKRAARKKPCACRKHRWKLNSPRTNLFLEAHHVKGIANLSVFVLPVFSYFLCTKPSTYVPEKVHIPYKTVTQSAL